MDNDQIKNAIHRGKSFYLYKTDHMGVIARKIDGVWVGCEVRKHQGRLIETRERCTYKEKDLPVF